MFRRVLIVTVAAVALLAGSAYAGSRWLITSTRQIKPSVLRQLHGKRGPAGARGPQGAQGPQGSQGGQGAQGPAGGFSTANVTEVAGPTVSVAPNNANGSLATCPSGAVVIGGGFNGTSTPPVQATVSDDGPLSGVAWDVVITNDSSSQTPGFTTYAVCATGTGASARLVRWGVAVQAAAALTAARAQLR